MTGDEFKAWRGRMSFNRTQAAEALGIGRNQPQKYEEGLEIPKHIELACVLLEQRGGPHMPDLTPEAMAHEAQRSLRPAPKGRQKEIIAVTIQRAGTRPFPSVHRYYVDWFDSNGLKALPPDIEASLMLGLKTTIIGEHRRLERSGIGQAPSSMFFEDMTLLAIFTTERAKALVDHWAYPLDLHDEFYGRGA